MKKLLVLLVIAFVGAGIAFGASTVFFSSSPEETEDVVEPQGLVDDLATEEPEPSPTPTASPKPTAAAGSGASGGAGGGSTGGGAAAAAPDQRDSGPRQPSGGEVINSQNGVVVTEGDGFSDECRDEDSEEEREQCEDDLEAEAEAEEEEEEDEEDEDD